MAKTFRELDLIYDMICTFDIQNIFEYGAGITVVRLYETLKRGNKIFQYDVVEHDDGTITVSPSVKATFNSKEHGTRIIHGFLIKGIWKEC